MNDRLLRECPVEGCTQQHDRAKMMCRPHWFSVSRELRDEVWSAFNTHGFASQEYEEARNAAIAAAEQPKGT